MTFLIDRKQFQDGVGVMRYLIGPSVFFFQHFQTNLISFVHLSDHLTRWGINCYLLEVSPPASVFKICK